MNSDQFVRASSRSAPDVRWIQQSLNAVMQAGLKVDGILGPLTRSAIRAFQRSRGLVPDAIVGPLTRAALDAALGSAAGGATTTQPAGPGAPPDLARLAQLRWQAMALIAQYVPSDTGDHRFAEIAQDFGGEGTTCGFLCHWLLWRLGCMDRERVNRNAPGGFRYRVAQNISLIWNGGREPYFSVHDKGLVRDGARPEPGDLVFVMTDPSNTKGGGGEHVYVFLQEVTEAGKTWWIGADAGQRNDAGRECARIVRRQLVIQGRNASVWRNGSAKVVMGWMPLGRLPFGPPPMPLPRPEPEVPPSHASLSRHARSTAGPAAGVRP